MLQKLFGFDPAQNKLKTEVAAGITTFLTMAYILAVNPNIFSYLAAQSFGSSRLKIAQKENETGKDISLVKDLGTSAGMAGIEFLAERTGTQKLLKNVGKDITPAVATA